MSRFTFGDALPLSGASAQLITTAIDVPYPVKLSEMAKRAGVSKYAASRAAEPLLESGILRRDEYGGYAFDDDHPMAPLLTSLAWKFSGVERRMTVPLAPVPDLEEDPFHAKRRLPESLHAGAPLIVVAHTGPNLVAAREVCSWISRIIPSLREFEADCQAVFAEWRNERLRDLVHQTLHFGEAAAAARATLAAATGPGAQGDADPREVRVDPHAWVRATFLLSAEARDMVRVIRILAYAIEAGTLMNTKIAKAASELRLITETGTQTQERIDRALNSVREADKMWSDTENGPFHNIGGTPRRHDVGTAGDMIFAVRLVRVANRLTQQVADMAAEPCVSDWIEANLAEAAKQPLLTDRVDDQLSSTRLTREG